MKDLTNYIITLSILITIIISCTNLSNDDISEDQLIGMWRINDNNDIIHFKDNNIFILTDWTCDRVLKKGN